VTGGRSIGRCATAAGASAALVLAACGDGNGLRGTFVFGHEVRTFQPCGSDSVLWERAPAGPAAKV
jgi:hypothetical protein